MSATLWQTFPVFLLGLVAAGAAWVWWQRRQNDPYDLRRLHDAHYEAPLADDEEADEDGVTEESGPYCHACDEAYPAGTSRCQGCGRPL